MIIHTTKRPSYIRWWMKLWKFKALTTFSLFKDDFTIYYRDAFVMGNKLVKKHELVHVTQIQRDGKFKFLVKYIWYWLAVGYWNNPYEIEARKDES